MKNHFFIQSSIKDYINKKGIPINEYPNIKFVFYYYANNAVMVAQSFTRKKKSG